MAARWSGKDENLITGNTEFLSTNTFNEAVLDRGEVLGLEMDTHSCMDPSILAIFEDSAVVAEAKSRLDEESESTLLTALADILDSVDDDTLSPFDTLPDTGLFSDQRLRENSPLRRLLNLTRPPDKETRFSPITSLSPFIGTEGAAVDDRLGWPALIPRTQASSSPTSTQRRDGEKERGSTEEKDDGNGSQDMVRLLNSVRNDHGYYSTVSLVDLVKLMHPYCLRVCLDEEGKDWVSAPHQGASSFREQNMDHEVNLEGEVWRYTKPGLEESDEEIDVDGTDDEECQVAKEKKRVSFGPVLVTSYEPPDEPDLNVLPDLSELTGQITSNEDNTKPVGTESLTSSSPKSSPGPCSDSSRHPVVTGSPERTAEGPLEEEPFPQPGGAKPRPALSLQQYRMLRQHKTLPLVARPENSTTKWPSVDKTPKELPPIPCLQGLELTTQGPEKTHFSHHQHQPAGNRAADSVSEFKPRGPDRKRKVISPTSPSKPGKISGLRPVGTGPKTPQGRLSLRPECQSAKARTVLRVGGLMAVRTCSETISPASPLLGPELNLNPLETLGHSRNNSNKRGVAVSSDPPNPVLVLFPGARPTSGELDVAKRKRDPLQPTTQSFPVPDDISSKRNPRLKSTSLLVEIQRRFSTKQPLRKRRSVSAEASALIPTTQSPQADAGIQAQGPPLHSLRKRPETSQGFIPSVLSAASPHSNSFVCPPNPVDSPCPTMERPERVILGDLPLFQPSSSPEGSTCIQTPTCKKGIEATDLTSLLERFEETQAKEKDTVTKSDPGVSPEKSRISCDDQVRTSQSISRNNEAALRLQGSNLLSTHEQTCPSELVHTQEALRNTTIGPRMIPGPQRILEPCRNGELGPTPGPLITQEQAPARTRWKPLTPVSPQSKQPSPLNPPARGRRTSRHYRTRSSCSDSSSRSPSVSSSSSSSVSRSRSPPRKRFRPRLSESSSSSCSCSRSASRSPGSCRYRLPYSRSRSWSRSRSKSKSWSRSRSRSRSGSPSSLAYRRSQRWRDGYSPTFRPRTVIESRKRKRQQEVRNKKLKAIDERRVVYVGRIRRSMTHAELRERFSLFGEVEECTLHFRDRGDHYGFVTFYNMEDAFAAIEKGYKLRRPDELPFDLCFGGRRQFCKSTYADLDSNHEEVDLPPAKSKFEELDFDTLLKQAQSGLKR
ncbi:hypothetical protein UPYG_G00060100 [Umbra pygmaea]|uniref:RRM domain-containing protein n=1 Tax=Umbra pygmaea TaxID=75934 RepID=A0ABD0X960_UMBPY